MTADGSCHKQVRIQVRRRWGLVDEGLADLLKATWVLGIETMSSCQDAGESLADLPVEYPHMAAYVEAERGWAYIDFLPFYGIGPFMDAIRAARPTDDMWRRMSHWTTKDAWQKRLHLHPIDDHFQPFGAQLLFPVYDIPEMVRCLQTSDQS